jgi:hypothetical protein
VVSAPVLSPSERAFVARVREAAAIASDAALIADRDVPPIAQAWQEVVTAADALLAAEPEEPLPWADSPDPEAESDPSLSDEEWAAPAPEPRYACMACDFTENSAHGANRHHDATGHNMRWTGRRATDEELADDCAPAPDAAADALLAAEGPKAGPQDDAAEMFHRGWEAAKEDSMARALAEHTTSPSTTSAPDAELTRRLEALFLHGYQRGNQSGHYLTATNAAVEEDAITLRDAIYERVEQLCQRREAAARGESGNEVGTLEMIGLIRDTVADDAQAVTYQKMGDYRRALLQ